MNKIKGSEKHGPESDGMENMGAAFTIPVDRYLISLVVFSLFYWQWAAQYAPFGHDEIEIYKKALVWYESGSLPLTGARVVYSGTVIPGALQNFLAGLPLFLSKGSPAILPHTISLMNWISCFFIVSAYRKWIPGLSELFLVLFTFYNPWLAFNIRAWNPSYLTLFSCLFFWSLTELIKGRRHVLASFGLGITLLSTPQLHLSFVLLFSLLLFLSSSIIQNVRWFALFVGSALPMVLLIPSLFILSSPSKNFSANVVFNSDNVWLLGQFFSRYLSFNGPEASYFLTGQGQGWGGTLAFFSNHPWLWPFYFTTLLVLFWGITISLEGQIKALLKFKSLEPFEKVVLLFPFFTAFSFLFSIKGPATHTFWILYPFSLFFFFKGVVSSHLNKAVYKKVYLPLYLVSFFTIGYCISVFY